MIADVKVFVKYRGEDGKYHMKTVGYPIVDGAEGLKKLFLHMEKASGNFCSQQ